MKIYLTILTALLMLSLLTGQTMRMHLVDDNIESFFLEQVVAITFTEGGSELIPAMMYVHLSEVDSVGYRIDEIEQITFGEDVSVEEIAQFISQIPIKLLKNYPNPFNPETTISFEISESGMTVVEVYNSKGQKIATLMNQELPAGLHSLKWNGRSDDNLKAASGVYFYRVSVNNAQKINKMVILK